MDGTLSSARASQPSPPRWPPNPSSTLHCSATLSPSADLSSRCSWTSICTSRQSLCPQARACYLGRPVSHAPRLSRRLLRQLLTGTWPVCDARRRGQLSAPSHRLCLPPSRAHHPEAVPIATSAVAPRIATTPACQRKCVPGYHRNRRSQPANRGRPRGREVVSMAHRCGGTRAVHDISQR